MHTQTSRIINSVQLFLRNIIFNIFPKFSYFLFILFP